MLFSSYTICEYVICLLKLLKQLSHYNMVIMGVVSTSQKILMLVVVTF